MFTTVLLTEKALTAHDVERFAHLHDPEPIHIHVVVPAHDDRSELAEVVDDLARADFAEALLDDHKVVTLTRAGAINGDQRVSEVARMLSGDPAGDASRGHAQELLRKAHPV